MREQDLPTWHRVQFAFHTAYVDSAPWKNERAQDDIYANASAFVRAVLSLGQLADRSDEVIPPPMEVFDFGDGYALTWVTARVARLVRVRIVREAIVIVPDLDTYVSNNFPEGVTVVFPKAEHFAVKAALALVSLLDDEDESWTLNEEVARCKAETR